MCCVVCVFGTGLRYECLSESFMFKNHNQQGIQREMYENLNNKDMIGNFKMWSTYTTDSIAPHLSEYPEIKVTSENSLKDCIQKLTNL